MVNNIMHCVKFATFGILLLAATGSGSPQDAFSEIGSVLDQAVQFIDQCGSRGLTVCFKERALKYLETTKGNIELTEGVTLKQTSKQKEELQNTSSLPLSLPEEPRARENTIDNLLMDRVAKFLTSHTLEFKLPRTSINEMKRSLDEGRKKRRRMLLPLLILLKLKAAAILPLFIGAVAIIALKALVAGKVALVVTGLVALKKLLENKSTSQTYEVVAHPHHSHSHITSYDDHHHHGYFRRALFEDPHLISPYSAYINDQNFIVNE